MFRVFTACVTLLSGFVLAGGALAAEAADESQDELSLLYVQTAENIALEGGKLTLKGVGKSTLFFSDRPQRVAGQIGSDAFVEAWGQGKDSFASDPPNATLSIFSGDEVQNLVVELTQPELSGDDLTYTVKLIEGKMPTTTGPASLFIDIIGMPFTPLSYAGVARRMTRRAIIYGSPAMHPVYATPAPVVIHQSSGDTTMQKMQELQKMYDQGLITQGQFDQKRQALLNNM